ncbi:hypothetical protein CSKR_109042 [Clonorchis sinensis]|uniref:Uncharacterized protein n=1 Tax=Clonorchis sinensis TaxID=79923 RepID=A0A3R7D6J1_CLOSI|nr:hypothetical protein CSKR_109042 [Clonorchis sinensis]
MVFQLTLEENFRALPPDFLCIQPYVGTEHHTLASRKGILSNRIHGRDRVLLSRA